MTINVWILTTTVWIVVLIGAALLKPGFVTPWIAPGGLVPMFIVYCFFNRFELAESLATGINWLDHLLTIIGKTALCALQCAASAAIVYGLAMVALVIICSRTSCGL